MAHTERKFLKFAEIPCTMITMPSSADDGDFTPCPLAYVTQESQAKKCKLNLQGGDAREAQLWSTEEVVLAKGRLRVKDDAEEQEKLDKVAKKAAATALRIQKKEEKVARALELAANRQLAKEAKARETGERKDTRQAIQKAKTSTKTSTHYKSVLTKAEKDALQSEGDVGPIKEFIEVKEEEEVVERKTRTRVIKLPQRLLD